MMDWIADDDGGREINGCGGNDRFLGAPATMFYGGRPRHVMASGDDMLHGGDYNDTLGGAMTICCMALAEMTVFRRLPLW